MLAALFSILSLLACDGGGVPLGQGQGQDRDQGKGGPLASQEMDAQVAAPAPASAPAPGDGPGQGDPAQQSPRQAQQETPAPQEVSEGLTPEEVRERRTRRVEKMFGKLIDPLTRASEAYERHDELEESSWFDEDQADNQQKIDELLDEALRLLEVSELTDARAEMRRLQGDIDRLERRILEDREARLSAPLEAELNKLERTYTTSREDLDQQIAEAEVSVEELRGDIGELEQQVVLELRAIGVDISLDSARSLLSSVAGDDFVEMCVVFDNVRGVTLQLQQLTEESGESLEAARRYYGSYVVLIRIMDRLQREFVSTVREEMIPRLRQYREEARGLIAQAQRNMRQGGNKAIGEQNIASNQLTIEATGFYVDYLNDQAAAVEARNRRLQPDLRDAVNTYDTVLLSSQVAELLQQGSRNFAALLELEVPELRGFENAELRAEFERLTRRMTNLQ